MKKLVLPENSSINSITISSAVQNLIELMTNATLKKLVINPELHDYYKSVVILKGNFSTCDISITKPCKIIFDNFSLNKDIILNLPNEKLSFVGNPLTPINVRIKSPCSIVHYTDISPNNLNFIIDYTDSKAVTTLHGNTYLGNIFINYPCNLHLSGDINNIFSEAKCSITLFQNTTINNLLSLAPINLYGYKDSLNNIPNNPLIIKEETIFLVDFHNNIGHLYKDLLSYSPGNYKLSLYVNFGDKKVEIPNNLAFTIEN